jgi:glycosyltransferase involved in cell wall biosynthesis
MDEGGQKLRVLQVCGSTAWGGLEMQMVALAEQLSARALPVRCLAHPDGRIASECIARGLPVITLELGRYFSAQKASRFRDVLRDNDIELVHCHLSRDLWSIIPATMGMDVPVILTKAVGSYVRKRDPLHRWLYARVPRIIAISDVIRRNVIDTCPIGEERVVTIYPGVDIDRFAPVNGRSETVRAEWARGGAVVGMVGRLEPWKGQIEFLEAMALVRRAHSEAISVIAGADTTPGGAFRSDLEERVRSLALDGSVIFTGHVSEVAALLRSLDIFVFPSRAEAFGLALAEAMATGVACVAARADGVEELIEHGVDGLLFEPGDARALATEVVRLLGDPDLRRRLGARAREKVVRMFSLASMVDRTVALYDEVV